jgi:hypothetical protein
MVKWQAFITRHNSTGEDRFRGADPFTQSKLVPILRSRMDSRLGEPRACIERHRESNQVPPDCESGELTTTLARTIQYMI